MSPPVGHKQCWSQISKHTSKHSFRKEKSKRSAFKKAHAYNFAQQMRGLLIQDMIHHDSSCSQLLADRGRCLVCFRMTWQMGRAGVYLSPWNELPTWAIRLSQSHPLLTINKAPPLLFIPNLPKTRQEKMMATRHLPARPTSHWHHLKIVMPRTRQRGWCPQWNRKRVL